MERWFVAHKSECEQGLRALGLDCGRVGSERGYEFLGRESAASSRAGIVVECSGGRRFGAVERRRSTDAVDAAAGVVAGDDAFRTAAGGVSLSAAGPGNPNAPEQSDADRTGADPHAVSHAAGDDEHSAGGDRAL